VVPLSSPQCEAANQTPDDQQSAGPLQQPPVSPPINVPPVSPTVEPPAPEHAHEGSQQQGNWTDKVWRHWGRRFFADLKVTDALVAIFTGLLALFTARLWIATELLWRAAQKQQTHMEQTSIQELRAYVLVSGAQTMRFDDQIKEVQLSIRNFGKTPAHNVKMWMGTHVREFPLSSEFQLPPEALRMGNDIIGPSSIPSFFQT
jgi:hypothetical protein